jgi:hypothetical protein
LEANAPKLLCGLLSLCVFGVNELLSPTRIVPLTQEIKSESSQNNEYYFGDCLERSQQQQGSETKNFEKKFQATKKRE